MAIMTIAGEAFNVLVEGDKTKPALIISNPLATNLHLWDRQMPAFLEHFLVVRTDSRGHGESRADGGPYAIERLGRDALAILDALEIEQAHWLGLSMGGMVGLWVLAHEPRRIHRAVLANTAAQLPGPELWNSRIRSARATGMAGVARTIAERWFTEGFRDSHAEAVESVLAMVRATPLEGFLAACAAVRDMDLREAIRGITTPVLVIVGRHDPSTPPAAGAAIASAIKGAQLVTLEASHISNIEDPETFTKAVVDFLVGAEPVATVAPPRRKAAGKKAALKKPATTAASVTKPSTKKDASKQAAGKKAAAEAAPAKKAEVKQALAKKDASKQAAGKKAAAEAAPAKRVTAKPKLAEPAKLAAKTATTKKPTTKKPRA
jgi:3-oxoadipate enol-lactonase